MSQERDTHFADLVAREIGKNVNIIFDTAFWPEEYYLEAISKIITQHAYDFIEPLKQLARDFIALTSEVPEIDTITWQIEEWRNERDALLARAKDLLA